MLIDTRITLPHNNTVINSPRIFCIGRNYAAHAAEMKSKVPEVPMVFLKPSTALARDGGEVVLPDLSAEIHHEVELVAVIGKGGKHIAPEHALDHICGYGVGLDMTARDIQAAAKKKGHPWSVAKGFDTFAPLGELVPASEVPDPHGLDIELKVNGKTRQAGNTLDMIFNLPALIAYCSRIFTLLPGDLLYTGTPEGVAQVHSG
ncbi:MAG: fumarylacetoacetate hydrolase family protein, partial [Bacteroidota bacterium]